MQAQMEITDETSWLAFGPARILQVFGYNNNAADDRYIQFHDGPTVAASDVPQIAKGLFAPANAPFEWDFEGGLWCPKGLLVAISSTEVNYSAVTNTGLDMTIVYETDFPVTSSTTVSGDLTTGVNSRAIWAQASGWKRLLRLDILNSSGATAYPFISAIDSPTTVNSAQEALKLILTGATGTYWFGRVGISPAEIQISGGTATNRQGCTVALAATAAVGSSIIAAGTPFSIRGIYE